MGTRADFYVGRGEQAEWLGSIAWDGYPDGIDKDVLGSTVEQAYREKVANFLERDDGTTPDMGWPWPWDTSHTTDFAYAYDDGAVYASGYGSPWWPATGDEPEEGEATGPPAEHPDMSARKAVTLGKRSGLTIFRSP